MDTAVATRPTDYIDEPPTRGDGELDTALATLTTEARFAAEVLKEAATTAIEIGYITASGVVALPAVLGRHYAIENHIIVTLIFTGCKSDKDKDCAAHGAWWLQYQWAEHYRWFAGSHMEAEGIVIAQYEYLGGIEELTAEEEADNVEMIAQLKEATSGN